MRKDAALGKVRKDVFVFVFLPGQSAQRCPKQRVQRSMADDTPYKPVTRSFLQRKHRLILTALTGCEL